MPTTLTFGHKKPLDGEQGATVCDALEDNIDLDDSHTHDGSNSDNVDSATLGRSQVTVLTTGWNPDGAMFKQTVTFPVAFSVGNGSEWGKASLRFFLDEATKDEVFPKIVRLSDTTFDLFSPVNDQGFVVTFT